MIATKIIKDLQKIVGKQDVLTKKEDLASYAYDGTTSWIHEPDVVVFPTSTEEVAAILKLANKHKIPVTPRGGRDQRQRRFRTDQGWDRPLYDENEQNSDHRQGKSDGIGGARRGS